MFSDKLTKTRAFNNLFNQFLEDVISVIPEKADIRQAKSYFDTLRGMNPSLIIKVWFSHVYGPYATVIDNGDIIGFIVEKDYDEDIRNGFDNVNEILKVINNIRISVRQMDEPNKQKVMEYIKKLSILSKLYSSTVPFFPQKLTS